MSKKTCIHCGKQNPPTVERFPLIFCQSLCRKEYWEAFTGQKMPVIKIENDYV
jgi:hypothetical protein